MARTGIFIAAIAALVLAAAPAAAAGRVPGGGGMLPIPNPQLQMQRHMMTAPVERRPYPMTYSEQVAQSLGVRKDGVSLFDARDRDSYTPNVSVGSGMLRLRWNQ